LRRAAGAFLLAGVVAVAADAPALAPFSALAPGELQEPWRLLTLANVKGAEAALVAEDGATVLRVRSAAASGSAAQGVDADPKGLALTWRWKVDRVVHAADMGRRAGDDYAARVYVFFDVPRSELPWNTRLKMAAIELIYGKPIPTAAICYVWDNRYPVGTAQWNAYTDRVRMVVLRSGDGEAGEWRTERRGLDADYRAAFGAAGPLPRVSGIAAGNDTDQTGERVTAWFGDFRFERSP
jgi:hypothetical protein